MTIYDPKIHSKAKNFYRFGSGAVNLLDDKGKAKAKDWVARGDLRWRVHLPLQKRHSWLLKHEGWYTTEPLAFEAFITRLRANQDIRRRDVPIGAAATEITRIGQDFLALWDLYVSTPGNKKAFPRWATYQGLWTSDFGNLYRRFKEQSAPVSFKLSCRFDDIKRMGDSPHFISCMADARPIRGTGTEGFAAKYLAMCDPNVFTLFVLNKQGEITWRTWGMLINGKEGYSFLLFRCYGNGPAPAIVAKLSELGNVYVDMSYYKEMLGCDVPEALRISGFIPSASEETEFRKPVVEAGLHLREATRVLTTLGYLRNIAMDVYTPYKLSVRDRDNGFGYGSWTRNANSLVHPHYEVVLLAHKKVLNHGTKATRASTVGEAASTLPHTIQQEA